MVRRFPGSTLSSDGRWTVEPTSEAAFATRVVVNRPIDKGDFNVRAFLGGFLRPEDTFNLVVVGAQSDILR